MDNNYRQLISKIDEFTERFYLNKLLRGIIFSLATLISTYLLLFVLVYCLNPGIFIKTVLFWSFVILSLVCVILKIIIPALAYFKVLKNMDPKESAILIGTHFREIQDKLLNTLQLKELADLPEQKNELILAGIDQKINDLKPIPFRSAIHLNENRKYIKYFLAPLLLILLIGIVAPVILREGTNSLIQYDRKIVPAAPFRFNLMNSKLRVMQGDSIRLELKLSGDQFPQDIYIMEGLNTFKFEKDNSSHFHYTFRNLQKDKRFYFSGGGFSSATYELKVIPRPGILSISASLVYPAYLRKENEKIQHAGDLSVPQGTTIRWEIATENSSVLNFQLGGQRSTLKVESSQAVFKSNLMHSTSYSIVPGESVNRPDNAIQHQIDVIPDMLPEINVNEQADSLSNKALYFTGNIRDDHGFSALKFIYRTKGEGTASKSNAFAIPVKKAQTENSFFYYWDLKTIVLQPGQQLEYFFEVTDNDAVNGPKSVRSTIKTYTIPTAAQIARQLDKGSSALKQKMESAIRLAAAVEKESKKLGENLLDKKALSFEDKKEISGLLDKQKKLEEAVKEIQKNKEENTFKRAEDEREKADLTEKQKQIDDLFNHVLDPKTKSLLEKLQQLMDQNSKDDTQQELSKMSMDNKSLKKELDRILELYKQLEFEQNLQNKIDRLEKMAAAQKELSQKSRSKNTSPADLKKEQQALNNDFDALRKEMQELEQKNQSLENPNPFQNPEKESKDIQQQQQESLQQLNKQQQQKAAENQEKAGRQMQELSKKLNEAQQESAGMENKVNAEALRTLLQNLLHNSFEQEKVMVALRKMNNNDPSYIGSVQSQRGIKDNMKTVADSLFSLSKKIPQIESTVNEEMQQINFNIDKSLDNLGERHTSEALKNQQYAMTSINNLSLMLNEVLDQLEKSQKNAKQGGKGNKKQSMQQLQQMQQQLNKNMQKAREQMEKNGNQGTVPKGRTSEEFAKMAQQQQMIREALQQLNSSENKDGKGSLGNLNQLIKEMKLTETELVNKRIEQATIDRQKNIMTKMLNADNADREQSEDQKRESKAGRDLPPSYQKMIEQFKKKQISELELQQKLPPDLNYYYKNKITDYFKLLNLQK